MNTRILLLVFLFCLAAVPAMAVSTGEYLGSGIQLGGSGTKVTQITTAATMAAAATVPPITLPATGSLSVTTSPAGATIFIDSVQRGVSPATIPGLSPGSHKLLLMLDGYEYFSMPVTITAGQTLTTTNTLSPIETTLPALPTSKKTPGFEAALGIAVLGAVVLITKTSR